MPKPSKRDELVEATKELLWEVNYEAMSPRDIQARSAARPGSLYHHLGYSSDNSPSTDPPVGQTAGEMSTLVSLVDSGTGVALLPASTVKRSIASVVACEIADKIPMSEIGIAVRKEDRAPVVDNFRSLVLQELGRARSALFANRQRHHVSGPIEGDD
jgi:DNA-binding transcriptional LysR family regulator